MPHRESFVPNQTFKFPQHAMHFLALLLEKDTVRVNLTGQKETSYGLILLYLEMTPSRFCVQCLLPGKWCSLERPLKLQEVGVGWRSRKWALKVRVLGFISPCLLPGPTTHKEPLRHALVVMNELSGCMIP